LNKENIIIDILKDRNIDKYTYDMIIKNVKTNNHCKYFLDDDTIIVINNNRFIHTYKGEFIVGIDNSFYELTYISKYNELMGISISENMDYYRLSYFNNNGDYFCLEEDISRIVYTKKNSLLNYKYDFNKNNYSDEEIKSYRNNIISSFNNNIDYLNDYLKNNYPNLYNEFSNNGVKILSKSVK